MSGFLYFIAIILIIFWAIGFIGYGAGWLIHVLLVIAVIAILLRLISGRRFFSTSGRDAILSSPIPKETR